MRGDLAKHYGLLLGLDSSWRVEAVRLELESKRVDISLEYVGSELTCPDCRSGCPRHDFAPERTWRHLDTMQFETLIRARLPRSKCLHCGVKTCEAARVAMVHSDRTDHLIQVI